LSEHGLLSLGNFTIAPRIRNPYSQSDCQKQHVVSR
jgi:hypothetical protein